MRNPDPATPLPWPRWAETVAVGGVWTLFTAVAVIARALSNVIPFSSRTVLVSVIEYAPWLVATPLVLWLARRVPLFGPRWARGLAIHVAVAVGVVLAAGTLQGAGRSAIGPPPAFRDRVEQSAAPDAATTARVDAPTGGQTPSTREGNRSRGRRSGRRGPWAPSLSVIIYLMLLGVGIARAVAIESAGRRDAAERAEAERAAAQAEADHLAAQVAEAHLSALRMQLRPHFLFNALNAVSALASDDPAEVRRIVARLSSMLRRVLDADARPLISLGEELAFARDYLDLQRVRFERLSVEEDVDGALAHAEVPTLVLQPLVENAVEHGAARGGGTVWVGARREGDRLVLTVGDDGPGLTSGDGAVAAAAGRTSVGLANTRARLEAHYGDAGSLVLRDRAGGGAEAVVTLPLDDDA